MGEGAYFVCYYGKPSPCVSGSRCFNGSIQCEQVRLFCDGPDDFKDFPDARSLISQSLDVFRACEHIGCKRVQRSQRVCHYLLAIHSNLLRCVG
ncbi:hypothetical protein D3C76_1300910 [compost metagenome]